MIAPSPKTHIVVKGDTLASIAGRWYRNPSLWPTIADANGITVPKSLRPGQVLVIPPLSS